MNPVSTLEQNYFAFFGLPQKLTLSTADLQTRFYSLSRQFHPDRFARRAALEQEYALNATALLNDAYRVLRDPIQRAEYLLAAKGFDIGEQRSNDVPPELLEEVFELNSLLEETPGHEELDRSRAKFLRMMSENDVQLQSLFGKYDASGDDQAILQTIRGALNRRRYIQNLVRDVEKAIA